MHIKDSVSYRVFSFVNGMILLFLMFVCLYPMLYVAFASLSNSNQLLAHQGLLLTPLGFNTEAYGLVFKHPMILKGYLNTIIVVFGGLTVNIIFTTFGAYALSRKGVLHQNLILKLVIFTMLFSGGLVPFFLTVKSLKLLDTYWALILPVAINTFNLIIMRTSFLAIPDSLEESAKIDGANDFKVLFSIVIPLSMPIIAVIILYYTVQHWNAWFNAMIFLKQRSMFPLQLILREILLQNDTGSMTMNSTSSDVAAIADSVKYAVIMVATLPILCLYPFLQKYFVKGVLIGAVKG